MNTVEEIKQKGLILFGNKGYEGTSMRDIAKEVGIKASSLYSHYDSKEMLFFEIFKYCFEAYKLSVKKDEYEKETNPKMKLYKMFEMRLNFFRDHMEIYQFLARNILFPPVELEDKLKAFIKNIGSSYSQKYASIYFQLKEENYIKSQITIEEFIDAYLRNFIGSVIQMGMLGKLLYKNNAETIFQLFWNGLSKECSGCTT